VNQQQYQQWLAQQQAPIPPGYQLVPVQQQKKPKKNKNGKKKRSNKSAPVRFVEPKILLAALLLTIAVLAFLPVLLAR